jgi:hypothetical protein
MASIGLTPLKDAKGSFMSIKLTDKQLVTLSGATQREDRCLVPPPKLKGGMAQKVAKKLARPGRVASEIFQFARYPIRHPSDPPRDPAFGPDRNAHQWSP